MTYTIKRVDPKSLDIFRELRRLQRLCLPGDTVYPTSEGTWWIAYHDGQVAGFAGLVPSSRWLETGYLCRAGVLPEHRGRGLQKKLIKVRIAHARRLGWRWLLTDTRQNPPSANSLIACGFKMYDPAHPWGFKDSVYWRRKI